MKRLYIVLFLTALSLLAAMASDFAVFYFLLYALIGALLGSFIWSAANLVGIHVSAQRRSGLAKVGDFAETELYISNRFPLPKVLLEVRDMPELPGQATGTVVNLRPLQSITWRARAPLRKRGVYSLGPVRAFSSDLFGLFRLRRTFPGLDEVTVYPATVDLPLFQLSTGDGFHQGAWSQRSHDVAPSVSTVRDYSYGDSLRRIHWPSTIRTSKLMVKEFDNELRNPIWIVLDLHRDVQAGGEIDNTEECGITIAASVARKFLAFGWPVGFLAHGDRRYVLAPQRNPAFHERLLSMLAVVQATGTEPLADVLRQAKAHFGSSSTLIIVTPSTDTSSLQGISALHGQRFQPVVVLIDAYSFGGRRGPEGMSSFLKGVGTLTYVVRQGEELSSALEHPSASGQAEGQGDGRKGLSSIC